MRVQADGCIVLAQLQAGHWLCGRLLRWVYAGPALHSRAQQASLVVQSAHQLQ